MWDTGRRDSRSRKWPPRGQGPSWDTRHSHLNTVHERTLASVHCSRRTARGLLKASLRDRGVRKKQGTLLVGTAAFVKGQGPSFPKKTLQKGVQHKKDLFRTQHTILFGTKWESKSFEVARRIVTGLVITGLHEQHHFFCRNRKDQASLDRIDAGQEAEGMVKCRLSAADKGVLVGGRDVFFLEGRFGQGTEHVL